MFRLPLNRTAKKSTKPKASRKLEIVALEQRLTPVVGSWDIPTPIDPGEGFDGVARIANGTGSLLTTARHMLTAGHVGVQDTGPGSGSTTRFDMPWGVVSIASAERHAHPEYVTSDYDLAVIELSELAPLTAERWGIYTDDAELGKTVKFYGYGKPGTGTSGHASEVGVKNPHVGNTELVRLSFTRKPTGGAYTISVAGFGSVEIPWNASSIAVGAALMTIDGLNDVWARKVTGDNPYAGAIEIQFKDVEGDVNDLDVTVQSNLIGGTAKLKTLIDGDEPRHKRTGMNKISIINDTGKRLWADFDDGTDAADRFDDGGPISGGREASVAHGDSGGPVFIGNKIAGVNTLLDSGVIDIDPDNADFGHKMGFERVSTAQDFINGKLDDAFHLVLNMNNQAPGHDNGKQDHITFRRVGDKLQIRFGNQTVYSESLNKILSIKVIGSEDPEIFTFENINRSIKLTVESNGGDDWIKLDKNAFDTVDLKTGEGNDRVLVFSSSNGSLTNVEGEGGDDVLLIAPFGQDLDAIGGTIEFTGGDGNDAAYVNDQKDTGADSYRIDPTSVQKRNELGLGTGGGGGNEWRMILHYHDIERLEVNANGGANSVEILGTSSGTETKVYGGAGKDTFTVLPPSALGLSIVGGSGTDASYIKGTTENEDLRIQGTTFDFNFYGKIGHQSVENFHYDGKEGVDTIDVVGRTGKVDLMRLIPSTTSGTGVFDTLGGMKLNFQNNERFDVSGNAGESDSFAMHGTSQSDRFKINMHASGTPGDRFAELRTSDSTLLLELLDAKNVGTVRFNGLGGNDLFEVFAGPYGQEDERKIKIDGGEHLDIRGDQLVLQLAGAETPIVNDDVKANDPDAGLLSVDFLSRQFVIQYDGIETKAL